MSFKNKIFLIYFIVTTVLFVVFVFLKNSYATTFYLMSSIMILEARFALIRIKFPAINPLKHWYHRKGTPKKYRKFCLIVSIIAFLLGTIGIFIQK